MSGIINFVNYWYFRYLLKTEMYIVERWERNAIHTIFLLLFLGFWYFNYAFVLSGVSHLTDNMPIQS